MDQQAHVVLEAVRICQDENAPVEAVLRCVMEKLGHVPLSAQRIIADCLGLPISVIAQKVAQDETLRTAPRARHTIKVCTGTACYVRGRNWIVTEITSLLGIEVGQATEDGAFAIQTAGCLGACGLAPVIIIDEEVFERVQAWQLPEILKRYGWVPK